ncbi:G-type lectin S-receptor-like serine/threonine-protein kinase At4g03230 isoform X2 [Prosopis cineraria]|uniref:G-type lectin S-receptor-like serine/threonine-protein kinase At4g03230 isoform X2 n=1 Tax=Prosopis cineraria TaxID=364024 RepID=UPI00240F1624|nr:G-type lectin S-receptor-like serine/threonine-protein kinase At4g03230 isoform X2 [Prosopis cineraria]
MGNTGIKIRRKIMLNQSANHMLPVFFLHALFFTFMHCSARDTISINNSLSEREGDTLISAGERFELGFFTLNGSSGGGKYVGIWYYESNPPTVVWVANRDNPLSDAGGVLIIAEDGNLRVLDGSRRSYWGTNLEMSSSEHRTAKLMDNGNLIMSDEEQGSHSVKIVWQSFANPTDTFLPGMKMDENFVLTSWRSHDDPAPGNFSFRQDQGENQYIIWKRSIRYWISSATGTFSGSGEMSSVISYLLSNFTQRISPNNSVPFLTSSLYGDTRLVMTYSGQLQYLKMDSQKVWSLVWAEPRDRCSVYNACGTFGSCNRRGASGDAVCWIWTEDLNNLQEEYEHGCDLHVRVAYYDIASNCRTCRTCGTNFIPYPLSTGARCGDPMYLSFHCNVTTGELSFETPGGAYQVISITPETQKFMIRSRDIIDCEGQSLRDKLLRPNQSSPFHLTGRCNAEPSTLNPIAPAKLGGEIEMSWDPPLEPLCRSFSDCKDWPNSICNTSRDGEKRCLCKTNFLWDGLILNCTFEGSHSNQTGRRLSVPLIIAVTFTIVSVLILPSSTVTYVYFRRRRLTKAKEIKVYIKKNSARSLYDSERYVKDLIESGRFKEDDGHAIDIPHFHLESILDATTNFSSANKLGQGGFGPVYKGKFQGGQEIAVKRLSSCSGQGLEEFKNEVVLIAKLQHRNLVRLLGYCVEGDEKMLVYEYMPNRSLDFFIFDRKSCVVLDWGKRFKIILGIARGLLYLHQDSRLRIIHRDLKTSNILLDEEMNPKISDFGLARIFGGKETAANTNRVVGTYGYMSPEYALDGFFSVKSDVFSFGVVVLEILSGKRNTGFYQADHELSLLGYAWHLWKVGRALDFMDQTLSQTGKTDEYLKCVNVGLLCVQEDPNDRPTMSNVVFMLGSDSSTLPTPKQPAFVVRRCPSSRASTTSKMESCSHNELTVTLEKGR